MTERPHERTLSPFEKNRFFQGKLMTPRDMTVEQEYHAERLHALARFVLGSGVVHGLSVASVTETDDLEVTVEPGLAIDGYGRPIQADRRTSKTLPAPDADEISLYVRHSERPVESAPVPDAGDTGGETAVNRTVETVEVTYRPGPPPECDGHPGVDITDLGGETPGELARQITEQYHDRHRSELDTAEDPAVFVDTFERNDDGEWVPGANERRRYAVDQELLFATLTEHLADDSVHGGSTGGTDPDVERLTDRLDRLESTVGDLERDRDALASYAVQRTLTERERRFRRLADRVQEASGAAGKLAREIGTTDRDRIDALATDEAAFRQSLDARLDALEELDDALEGICTERTVTRYREAVSELAVTLDSDQSLLAVVRAHDQVCDCAERLEPLVDVVPADA